MIIPIIPHKKKSEITDFIEISAEDYCRKQEQIKKNHKIIDCADLVRTLLMLNFYPAIVQRAIEMCPALDLFEEVKHNEQ